MGGTQFDDGKPVHEVTLSMGYYMGVYPVTQAEWKAVMGDNPSLFMGSKRPVDQVSREDASVFCLKLTGHTGIPLRLPTEAEWEYACRAGTTSAYWWGDIPKTDRMNYKGDEVWNGSVKGQNRGQTTDVGSFAGNPWGLHDTHGNVLEWCVDYWHSKYDSVLSHIDPVDERYSLTCVLRGGSWSHAPQTCRSAYRVHGPNLKGTHYVGFRVCFCLD